MLGFHLITICHRPQVPNKKYNNGGGNDNYDDDDAKAYVYNYELFNTEYSGKY
jgi:hypothetical protein